jgi:hypothetical protein
MISTDAISTVGLSIFLVTFVRFVAAAKERRRTKELDEPTTQQQQRTELLHVT